MTTLHRSTELQIEPTPSRLDAVLDPALPEPAAQYGRADVVLLVFAWSTGLAGLGFTAVVRVWSGWFPVLGPGDAWFEWLLRHDGFAWGLPGLGALLAGWVWSRQPPAAPWINLRVVAFVLNATAAVALFIQAT